MGGGPGQNCWNNMHVEHFRDPSKYWNICGMRPTSNPCPTRASERPVAMRSARDAVARPPSCRRLARSSPPCRRPSSGRPEAARS
eukprot:1782114-Prymnesium_polylepis.1